MSKIKEINGFAGFVFQLAWIMLSSLPALGMTAEDAPATVTIGYLQELYETVSFDHQTHSEMYECSSCHHHTTGTGTQSETCKMCHAAARASDEVSCSGCHIHKKTSASSAANSTTDTARYHIDKPSLKGALHLQCLGCHRSENGPVGCQDCHSFTSAGRKRFALEN